MSQQTTTNAAPVTAPESTQPVRKHTGVDDETTTTHTTTTTDGNYVDVKTETSTDEKSSDSFDSRVLTLVRNEDQRRQKLEDARATRRNINRMYTLIGAILIGLIVVYTLPKLGHVGAILSPYSFCITVLFDSAVTAWALYKHY